MRLTHRRQVVLAVVLAGIAGFVDAIGFVHLGGYFVSFMSGNTTRLAAGTAQEQGEVVAVTAALLAAFFLGVVVGAITALIGPPRSAVLWVVTATQAAAAILAQFGFATAGLILMASSMGMLNSVFQRHGEVTVGLTYMTGTLVKAGQRLVDAFNGGPRWLWLRYILLWAGLAVGALCGAVAYRILSIQVLWLAVGLTLAAAAVTTFRTPGAG